MVPMPPSRIRMRSRSAAWSLATRSEWSQGRVVMGMFLDGLRLACQQADDFEMRRLALAAEAIGAHHIQPRGRGKTAELFEREAEIDVVERLHRRAVVVLAQRDRQQAPAGTQ